MSLGGRLRDYFSPREEVDTSPKVSDEVKYTTCYMCACRCGIKVHLKNGGIRYIEGNRDHPVNRGVICGKGASGIMQQHSPAKLRKPLKRVGERGSGEFREIEWEEAIATAVEWLSAIRSEDPKRLAFFTGRDQSQSLTGYWAAQFGTPNFAAHGGFCSVNMAAAGMYTLGSSFWEFGEPDWLHTRFFMMFGVAEDHDSNPIKIALSGLRQRGARFVSVNPVRTGYSAIADEWVGIRPGTDGLLVMALIHELLKSDRIDLDYLVRYTNAAWLVIQAPGAADDGLFARNEAGEPLVLEASGSRFPSFSLWPSAISMRATPLRRSQRPAASRPRRSGGSPRSSVTLPSKRRSNFPCRGPTGPDGVTRRCAVVRFRYMRCAGFQPIRTGSKLAERCICCSYSSAPSTCRAVGATSRRIPSRPRPGQNPQVSRSRSSRASRCRECRWVILFRPRI
jgi:anaerobic selenocysteine-containing dehydrogenase